MKHFFRVWHAWWFITMVPIHTPPTTVAERENRRKRNLLSVIILLSFVIDVIVTVAYFFSVSFPQMFFCGIEAFILLFSLWLNRREFLLYASVVFYVSESLNAFITAHIISLADPHYLLWVFSPCVLLLAGAAMFVSARIVFVMAISENIFVFYYLLVVRHTQILHILSPQEIQNMLIFFCLILYVSALIGTLNAKMANNAVIQADRADELEQAHHSLTDAYTHLEKAYSDLEMAHVMIQKQALTDGLTGLPNHRAIVDQLEKELDRARRYGHPFSLLFFDADRFKHINDTYGHGSGDAVLRQIGERVGNILRGADTLGRFGGEEFVLLLPETDADEAIAVAERVRATIANEPMVIEDANSLNTTVSVGVAMYPTDGYSGQELLQQADQAMYVAKRLGRNQVRTAIEAVHMSADVELMAILQKEEQREAEEREGITPERIRENYTVKLISSLMNLLELRDHGMGQHAYAVSDMATAMAQAIGQEPAQISRIGMAALLHDIGKVAVPDMLLQKAGRLDPHERVLLKEHAELGAQILEGSPFLHDLMPAVRHHHERWDGSGYPDQLAREDIPLAARIIGVAEAYDAMTRDHPYQASRTSEEAVMELLDGAGTQFDPKLVQVLVTIVTGQYEQLPQTVPTLVP
jgi:diguanylate cyclase (GGDEF)-like protein/putative nucleotidyltransferase with HDIG domain